MTPELKREQFLEKQLPASPQSEQCLLSQVFFDNNAIYKIIGVLSPDEFYSPFFRKVLRAMIAHTDRKQKAGEPLAINPVTIAEELKLLGFTEDTHSITNITYGIPHFNDTDVDEFIQTVKAKAIDRALIKTSNEIISRTLSEEYETQENLDLAESQIYALRDASNNQRQKDNYDTLARIAETNLKNVAENVTNGRPVGLKTGLEAIDEPLAGLKKTELILIAGRPSTGKSSLGLKIVNNVADFQPESVSIIFSIEMSKELCGFRMIAQRAKVDLQRLMNGRLSRDEWARVAQYTDEVSPHKIIIVDAPNLRPMEMRHHIRRIGDEHKRVDLILTDHIHLAKSDKVFKERRLELEDICREYKSIAKEFSVPHIALAQLSRAPELRKPPRPIMSDLRESGSLEEIADSVAFLYREEYYNKTEENTGLAELIWAKNRNAPTGTEKMAFLGFCTSFENYCDI